MPLTEVKAAYLFGSHANDRARPDSDIDVAVLFGAAPAPDERKAKLGQLIEALGRELNAAALDVVILDDAPPKLAFHVLKHGRIVFERGRRAFANDYCSGPVSPVGSGRMQRSDDLNRELALGVVGAGRWGRHWVRVASELSGARLAAVCDADPSRRAQLVPAGQQAAWFGSFGELLDQKRVRVDALIIATPTSSHATLALAALDAERHVLVEKPLAASLRDALRIEAHPGGRVMTGHLLRYHPAVKRLRTLIDAGELGRVERIECHRLGAAVGGREETAWWALAPHDISVMRFLFGCDPVSIGAVVSEPTSGPEDSVMATLGFAGGELGVIRVGGQAPAKVRRIRVVGTRRSITFVDQQQGAVLLYQTGSETTHEERVLGAEPLRLQAQHFVDSLRSGQPFASDAREGALVVRVLEAGSRALETGRAVTIEPALGSQAAE